MFQTLTRFFRRKPAPEAIIFTVKPADNSKVSPADRAILRDWLNSPTTLFALALVESQRPSIVLSGIGGSVEERRYNKETRLTQLQGWESYRNSLLSLRFTPDEIKAMIEESYPDQK